MIFDIVNISSISYDIQDALLSADTVQSTKDSVAFTNPNPATGGSSGQTIREVRESALAYYQSQQRSVTKDDYIVRAYSLPPKYGSRSVLIYICVYYFTHIYPQQHIFYISVT